MTAQRREVKVSVQLRRLARDLARNTNELRVILALERMVARLHTSSLLRDQFVFKEARQASRKERAAYVR
jgi:hypothetical protein